MLRWQGTLSTGLGLLVVGPLVAQGLRSEPQNRADAAGELHSRLEQTRVDLAQLEELRPGVIAGDPAAIEALRRLTESGPLELAPGEARAQSLRLDIAQKEQHLAQLQRAPETPARGGALNPQQPAPAAGGAAVSSDLNRIERPAATDSMQHGSSVWPTGGGDATSTVPQPQDTLSPSPSALDVAPAAPLAQNNAPSTSSAGELPSVDQSGADRRAEATSGAVALAPETAFRRARSAYLAGEHLAALDRFRALDETPASRYWIARCLERLGRTGEALERYEELAADPDAGRYADLAAEGAEFLGWKADLEGAARQVVERTRTTEGSQ